jgi:hypothetical protein
MTVTRDDPDKTLLLLVKGPLPKKGVRQAARAAGKPKR